LALDDDNIRCHHGRVKRTDLEAKLRELGYEPGELSSDPRYRAWRRRADGKRRDARTIWLRQDELVLDAQAERILSDAAR